MARATLQLLAAASVVAAFGTTILMPAIKNWSDMAVFWWLCYVVTVAVVVGSGRPQLSSEEEMEGLPTAYDRAWISLVAAAMPLLYIGLNILVLDQTISLSGLKSSNPIFWRIVAAVALGTWLLTWLFSHSKGLFATIVKWIDNDATEAQVNRISRVMTALVGLVGAMGLLARAFFTGQD